MNNVLDGLAREQALGCICVYSDENENVIFVKDGIAYGCPDDMGIAQACKNNGHVGGCPACWRDTINAFYDEQERPKWAETMMIGRDLLRRVENELIDSRCGLGFDHLEAEIARTNARRKIEAFIRENAKPVDIRNAYWEIRWYPTENKFCPAQGAFYAQVGSWQLKSRELAEEIIRRYPDELRLLI
jgi:hypothetical protein